jgi:metal-responsive CopG/Arc/MetJ family transcriptional regulator
MAKNMLLVTRKTVSLPDELWKAILGFRQTHFIPSDSEAIRRLLCSALKAVAAESASGPRRRGKPSR